MGIIRDTARDVFSVGILAVAAWAIIKNWDKINPFKRNQSSKSTIIANPDGSARTTDGSIIFGGSNIGPDAPEPSYVDHSGEPGWEITGYTSQGFPIWEYTGVTDVIDPNGVYPGAKPKLRRSGSQSGYSGSGSITDPYRTEDYNAKLRGQVIESVKQTSIGDIIVSSPGTSSSNSGSSYKSAKLRTQGYVEIDKDTYRKVYTDDQGRTATRIIEI